MDGNNEIYASWKVETADNSALNGKKILFLGSSVTFGAASFEDGIPEYFAKRFGCQVTKEAVSGTTLVDQDQTSYVSRLKNNIDKNEKYDLVICQLSTNDATKGLALGKIEETREPDTFDTLTILGAIEYIIAYVKKNWNCPVAFYTGSRYESDNYQAMVEGLYALSKKWDIGVLDLWSDDGFNDISEDERSLYMADPIHPKKAGYMKWWCPELEKRLLAYIGNKL